jgi:predicted transcriptional regulator
VLSNIEVNRRKMIRHATNLKNFIGLVKKPAFIITENAKDEEIMGIPLIERKKLEEMDKRELIKKAEKAI